MKKNIIILLAGVFVGWLTVPFLQADPLDSAGYKTLLRRVIQVVEQIQITSKETADNTRAIKEKLGAK